VRNFTRVAAVLISARLSPTRVPENRADRLSIWQIAILNTDHNI
jgi:hypothetical protein